MRRRLLRSIVEWQQGSRDLAGGSCLRFKGGASDGAVRAASGVRVWVGVYKEQSDSQARGGLRMATGFTT